VSPPRIALVTEARYEAPAPGYWYTDNILEEDRLVTEALAAHGLHAERVSWARPDVDWSQYAVALLRTPWDYFERFDAFTRWLHHVSARTRLLNPLSLVRWNVDKHYLAQLEDRGVHVVPTVFVEPGQPADLAALLAEHQLDEAVIKPAVSGGARHTYRLRSADAHAHQPRFEQLVRHGAMLLQPYVRDIVERGEMTLVVIDGRVTHALRKVAKPGDFRVQDDHGGTVHPYEPSPEEVAFAQRAIAACQPAPLYGRVDMVRDAEDRLAVMELELVEPELWFRLHPPAAEALARGLVPRLP